MESWVLHNSLSYMAGFLFLKLFFRGSQVSCFGVCGRAFTGVRDLFVSVFASVARVWDSPLLCGPHWWKHTLAGKHRFHRPGGGCGCEAAGGEQSWRTPSVRHRKVDIHYSFDSQRKLCFPLNFFTIRVHKYLRYGVLIPSLAISTTAQKQISSADGKRSDECWRSVNRDMSVVKRGPQEAQGRLLPFSCMQEKHLIIRVVWEGRVTILSCLAGQTHTLRARDPSV